VTDLSSLCRACGLCCDGSLFQFVRLDAADAARARAARLPVIRRDDGADALSQRCAALTGRDCSIYADRPSPCASYECLLVAALRDGEVSADEALAIVVEAHSTRATEFLLRHFLGRTASAGR
jgi:Fe-S-cluster containining protein